MIDHHNKKKFFFNNLFFEEDVSSDLSSLKPLQPCDNIRDHAKRCQVMFLDAIV